MPFRRGRNCSNTKRRPHLTPLPRTTTTERFVTELPADTTSADVEVKVTCYPSPKTELLIHQVTKKLTFK